MPYFSCGIMRRISSLMVGIFFCVGGTTPTVNHGGDGQRANSFLAPRIIIEQLGPENIERIVLESEIARVTRELQKDRRIKDRVQEKIKQRRKEKLLVAQKLREIEQEGTYIGGGFIIDFKKVPLGKDFLDAVIVNEQSSLRYKALMTTAKVKQGHIEILLEKDKSLKEIIRGLEKELKLLQAKIKEMDVAKNKTGQVSAALKTSGVSVAVADTQSVPAMEGAIKKKTRPNDIIAGILDDLTHDVVEGKLGSITAKDLAGAVELAPAGITRPEEIITMLLAFELGIDAWQEPKPIGRLLKRLQELEFDLNPWIAKYFETFEDMSEVAIADAQGKKYEVYYHNEISKLLKTAPGVFKEMVSQAPNKIEKFLQLPLAKRLQGAYSSGDLKGLYYIVGSHVIVFDVFEALEAGSKGTVVIVDYNPRTKSQKDKDNVAQRVKKYLQDKKQDEEDYKKRLATQGETQASKQGENAPPGGRRFGETQGSSDQNNGDEVGASIEAGYCERSSYSQRCVDTVREFGV